MKKKSIMILLLTSALLAACSDKETEEISFKEFVVDKDDLKPIKKEETPTKSADEYEIQRHNNEIAEKANEEYKQEVESEEQIDNNQPVTLESYNKWDAIVIMNIFNQYSQYFNDKDVIMDNFYIENKESEIYEFGVMESYEISRLNQVILDLEKEEYFSNLESEELLSIYSELKKFHKVMIQMIEVEELKSSMNLKHHETNKKEYLFLEKKFLKTIGVNKLMNEEEFRKYIE